MNRFCADGPMFSGQQRKERIPRDPKININTSKKSVFLRVYQKEHRSPCLPKRASFSVSTKKSILLRLPHDPTIGSSLRVSIHRNARQDESPPRPARPEQRLSMGGAASTSASH